MTTTDLFTPLQLGPSLLKNRMVMAPLTRNRATTELVPQAINVEYYKQRASAGLIITEASPISTQGVGYPLTPGIFTQAQTDGWKKVVDAVHEKGGHIFIQLWHVGRISHPSFHENDALPVAPSAIRPAGDAFTYTGLQPFVTPRALATEELAGIVEQYRKAAEYAKQAGFDGIEVHAANGYLLDEFLRDGTNQRTDEYGGSVENRCRLLMEVIDAVTSVWPANQVGVRISPENSFNDIRDSDPQTTFNEVAKRLSTVGLAYLHAVEGDITTGERKVNYREIKDHFGGLYMANYAYDRERAQAAIKQGDVDMVAFGALYIANPDLVERFKVNAPLNAPDQNTFYGGDEHGYTDYPFMQA
ncbi:alkene reductase [Sulfuriflexus mobilis]|uniref:alkene reductase n=1 Tax=Sulfuriflexus mobilis TaxID=1811807 RepID=UPI000F836B37|nr:alkene reductase [Sulfuriflexus mobilis]